MVALFLLLRVFCVCPQPDVSEKISITVIKNYRVRGLRVFSRHWNQLHDFQRLETVSRLPMLDSTFVSVPIGSLSYRHLI